MFFKKTTQDIVITIPRSFVEPLIKIIIIIIILYNSSKPKQQHYCC